MSLTVQVAGKSDIGCVRKNNEDNLGWDQRLGLYVVCDGMGGALAGEVASQMGVELVLDYFREGARTSSYPEFGDAPAGVSLVGRRLTSAIQRANTAIYEAGQAKQSQHGMGSTIVCLMIQENFVTIAHAGDSRIYRLRDGVLDLLTQDHSLVMEQYRRGMITLEQAEQSDMQNIIIKALGSEDRVEPDVQDLIALRNDIYLLATDGLTKLVKDDAIKKIMSNSPSLDRTCEDLINAAKQRGGDDNITCLLLRVAEEPWYARLASFLRGGGQSWRNSS
ncbi:MAG: Stp1/IreP family PP2C-type Ser/Thr phosphatase [Acidobacteria bacterium]|nr:Stp1/IreP family PP2C-type Ser/Thr phosphatase [Acidobacteriota bacterium]MBV9145844.1 Stp1/IreP family PP2C-type Ser/Thr phosphatase [Acidobacteriota bacterium]